MRQSRQPRTGTALIVSTGVLLVLSTLAIAFARTANLERLSAHARTDHVQARFAAIAGYEHAVSAIERAVHAAWDDPRGTPHPWFYRGHPGRRSGNGVPLAEATLPSMHAGTSAFGRAYSGVLPEWYEPAGNTYVLKVLDSASMIDLNQPSDSRRLPDDEPFVRMLSNLGSAIDPANPPVTREDAKKILAYRATLPGGRFDSRRQILSVPGGPISQTEFDRLADFVTVHAWTDSSTVAPMDPALMPVSGNAVYGRVPTGKLLRQPRSPVNINTAPVEVLIAVFADLVALWVDRDATRDSPDVVGIARRTRPITLAQARQLADRIVERRDSTGPFRGWEEFRTFAGGVVATGAVDSLQGAAILANVDPNINTHRANPDAVVWRTVDKFDLAISTTELAFHSAGIFEIESLGRITANGGQIEAQVTIRAVVSLFTFYRESAQSQFNAGRVAPQEVEVPTIYRMEHSFLTDGSARVFGDARFEGKSADVHANGDLEVTGNPVLDGDATAAGSYQQWPSATVAGQTGGSQPTVPIPNLFPATYRAQAEFVFGADGTVRDRNGNVVGQGSFRGFTLKNGAWQSSCDDITAATYYFEGDVEITGGTKGAVWKLTIFATGHISVRGNPRIEPNHASRITFLAGTDISVSGTPGASLTGVFYAGEQVEYAGNTVIEGATIAKGRSQTDPLVRDNQAHGSVIVRYSGGLVVPGDPEKHKVVPIAIYPDPNATAVVDGQTVNLSSFDDHDGYIALAPVNLPRAVLGSVPYRDSILATWEGSRGLDADVGGGALGMLPETIGPIVAPITGVLVPGSLLRDGVYSERRSVGAFEAVDNLGALRGTIAFWFKPSWDAAQGAVTRSSKNHHLLALSRRDGADTQEFWLHRRGDDDVPADEGAFHFDRSAVRKPDTKRRVESATVPRWTPAAHGWVHVALAYDFLETDYRKACLIYVNGVPMPGWIAVYTQTTALDPTDLAKAAITPGNLVRLGERAANTFTPLSPVSPDGTYDEFVATGRIEDASWVAMLHSMGRYYSGGSAIYTSTTLPIPAGARLVHAAWTVRYPDLWNGPSLEIRVMDGATPAGSLIVDPASGAAGMGLSRTATGAITYDVIFQRTKPVPGAPFYTTPIVDDVTVAFTTGPRVLAWEEVL